MKMEAGLVEQRRDIVEHVNDRVISKKKVRRRPSSLPLKRKIPVCLALQQLYSCCKKVFKGPGFVPPPQDVQSLCTILGETLSLYVH